MEHCRKGKVEPSLEESKVRRKVSILHIYDGFKKFPLWGHETPVGKEPEYNSLDNYEITVVRTT